MIASTHLILRWIEQNYGSTMNLLKPDVFASKSIKIKAANQFRKIEYHRKQI